MIDRKTLPDTAQSSAKAIVLALAANLRVCDKKQSGLIAVRPRFVMESVD